MQNKQSKQSADTVQKAQGQATPKNQNENHNAKKESLGPNTKR